MSLVRVAELVLVPEQSAIENNENKAPPTTERRGIRPIRK